MLSKASSSRALQSNKSALHGKSRRVSRSNDEIIPELVRSSSSGMTFLRRSMRASEAASCGGGSAGCVGDVGVVHASGILRRDDESSTTTPRITNDSKLGSLLKMRGGASYSSHRGNNAVQGVLKSILASPSLPSPIKQLIEMLCGFIENLTDWKVLPHVDDHSRKSKSKMTKPRRRERVIVDEASVGGATRTTRIPKKRVTRKAENESEEVEMAVLAKKKRRKRSPKVESASGEPAETIVERAAPAASAEGGATTALKPNPPTVDAASKKFLSNSLKSSNPNYRIQRELKEFLSSPPPGLSVKISGKNVRLWIVTLDMPSNTIYAGETYRLRIQFPPDYPTSPPSVYFLSPTPRHEHVYTNGDICLSLLGTDWRPIMTAQSVAQAIMSILCGAQRKSLPMDNARHAGNKPGKKQDDWVYHDDNC